MTHRLDILVLAAGASTRMLGADKLLESVDGMPQLARIVDAALATGARVMVTLPPESAACAAVLAGRKVDRIGVPTPSEGMAASIRAGAAAATPGAALLIVPADMPEIEAADLAAVIAVHQSDPLAILRGSAEDVAGHPVVIPVDLVPDLQRLHGDSGARGLIRSHAARLRLVPLPERHALLDLDTPDAWSAWRAARGKPRPDAVAASPLADRFEREHPSMRDPLFAASLCPDEAVLAVITGTVGASYRAPGTMMAFLADGQTAGNLTNGCIEGDVAVHAREALATNRTKTLRYGAGSPFFDIRLPCGGGLDIALYPRPNPETLAEALRRRSARDFFSLRFDAEGRLDLQPAAATGWQNNAFLVDARPDLRLALFGEGPEAVVFARLAQAAGYPHCLRTPNNDTFDAAHRSGCSVERLRGDGLFDPAEVDARTAVVTFFHDHDREMPILKLALQSPAFYVGAQGSRRVAERQAQRLAEAGLDPALIARLHAPIGLIPSARDPRTLATSVLAEILKVSRDAG